MSSTSSAYYADKQDFDSKYVILKILVKNGEFSPILKVLNHQKDQVQILKLGLESNFEKFELERAAYRNIIASGLKQYTDCIVDIDEFFDFSLNLLPEIDIDPEMYVDKKKGSIGLDYGSGYSMPVYEEANFENMRASEFRGFIFEIFYTLAVCKKHKISHGDLHRWNVMKLEVDFARRYTINDRIYTVRSDYIPILIDWSSPIGEVEDSTPFEKSDAGVFWVSLMEDLPENKSLAVPSGFIEESDSVEIVLHPYFDRLQIRKNIRAGEKVKFYPPLMF